MRGSRPSQSDTAILPSELRVGRERLLRHHVEPGGGEPSAHRLGREAEPAMGVLVAQEFEIVRREVDHQQPPGRPQHARRFRDRARAVVEEVQHLMDDDDVEGILRQREIVDVALPHAAMAQAGAVEPRARERQHVERHVEAEAALDRGPNSSSMRPVPVPRSSSERNGLSASAATDRLLHRVVGDVQLADAVPLGGMAREIFLRRGGARGAHGGEPLAVAGDGRRRAGSSRATSSRASAALPPRSPSRKNAQEPSRKRSTSPASASSRRCREMRGCDWRRMSVRSETVSSASASSATMRRRVSSPAALSAPLRSANGSWAGAEPWAWSQSIRHIKISLYL